MIGIVELQCTSSGLCICVQLSIGYCYNAPGWRDVMLQWYMLCVWRILSNDNIIIRNKLCFVCNTHIKLYQSVVNIQS